MGSRGSTRLRTKMKMILFALVLCISSSFAGKLPAGVDDLDNVTLEEFLEDFGLDEVDDPEEAALMEEALEENEEIVKEANEAFANGDQTWYDEINEFDDLPEDEFIAEHTGLLTNLTGFTRGMGLLDIPIPYDEASERLLISSATANQILLLLTMLLQQVWSVQ